MKTIGLKIRELRIHQGRKLKELSQKVGVTASFLSQVERGVAVPSISSLKKISDALNMSITSFFDDDQPGKRGGERFFTRRQEIRTEDSSSLSGCDLSPSL